jgi:hypothetical protein
MHVDAHPEALEPSIGSSTDGPGDADVRPLTVTVCSRTQPFGPSRRRKGDRMTTYKLEQAFTGRIEQVSRSTPHARGTVLELSWR